MIYVVVADLGDVMIVEAPTLSAAAEYLALDSAAGAFADLDAAEAYARVRPLGPRGIVERIGEISDRPPHNRFRPTPDGSDN